MLPFRQLICLCCSPDHNFRSSSYRRPFSNWTRSVYNDIKNTFTVAWLGTSNFDADDYPERAADNSLVTKTVSYAPTWSSGDTTSLFSGASSPNLAAPANQITGITSASLVPVTSYTVTPSSSDQNTSPDYGTIKFWFKYHWAVRRSYYYVSWLFKTQRSFFSLPPAGTPCSSTFRRNDLIDIPPAGAQGHVDFAYLFLDAGHT